MKHKITGGFAVVLLGVLLLAGTRVAAQPEAGHGHHFGGPGMFRSLQLSDEQKSSIQNLFAANRESLRPLHEQLQQQRQLLREAAQMQPFDEAQVRFQAQEMAKLQAEMMVARASVMNQVTALLTPEQRSKLSTLQAERRERFQQRHQHQRSNPDSHQG